MTDFREERIGGQRLILGNCLDVMPTLVRFDAVVTDPPYGIGKRLQGGSWATKDSHFMDMHNWDLETKQEWFDACLSIGDKAIVWGGNYFQTPPSRCWLTWRKPYFPSMADFEMAFTNIDHNSKSFSHPRSAKNDHPTQKPIALMEWCLSFLPNATTILDPFMGSGTTLVACQRIGRMGTGIEIDPEYFEIACRRVDEATRQPDLFIEQPPKPQQLGMWEAAE